MTDPDSLLNVIIMHEAFSDAIDRIEMAQSHKDKRRQPECLALLGESGAGKSFLIDFVKSKNPSSETDEGMVIPLVCASVPSKPTIKNLAEEILSKLDPEDPHRRYTEGQITRRIEVLLDQCDTDVIVLEEFQHFYDRTTERVWEYAADWLKRLIDVKKEKNGTNRLLIVSGLKQSIDVILQNPQLIRRFKAPLFLPCFSWRDPRQRGEFAACYNGFADVLKRYFSMPDAKTNDMYFRCYCATGGLIGHLKALLQEVVEYASKNRKKVLGLKDFDAAFDRYLFVNSDTKVTYRPFSESFSTIPTDKILNQALQIGASSSSQVSGRGRSALCVRSTSNSFVGNSLASVSA